jgi:enoyl-CoA hydratase/carnithine racemase
MGSADARLAVPAYDDLSVLTVDVDAGVAWITIDHPPMNLWDAAFTPDFVNLVGAVEADDEVRVAVLTSADPEYFIAHADVRMILQMPSEPREPSTEPAPVNQLLDRLGAMPKVWIAAIAGIARGGGSEIALACDMRFAARSARLGQPEVALGIIPGAGGTQRLTKLVGRARALEIVLGCGDVTADEAATIGYVNRVLPDDDLEPFVRRVATRIAAMPAGAVAGAKEAVSRAHAPDGFMVEADRFHDALGEPEATRRMEAFLRVGGQTREGERDLDAIIDRLSASR